MRELDALRRPGRARGVDQREQVVGLDRAPARPRRRSPGRRPRRRPSASVPSPRAPSSTITCSSAGSSRARLQRRSANASSTIATLRAGVADHVGDLLGRGGLVDRERRRAERHRREVGEVELGPVGEHQRDGVAARARRARAARRRARRRARAARAQVSETSSSLRADGDAVRVVLGRDPERLGDRRGADGARRGARRLPWSRSSGRAGRRRYRTLKPSPVQPPDVVREADHEQHDHEREADEAGALHDRERDRPAAHLLGQRPEDVAAVERQEREQVDDAERQRDQREQVRARVAASNSIAWRVAS